MASQRGDDQAYPRRTSPQPNGDIEWGERGMTIREVFAKDIAAGYRAHHGGNLSPADLATLSLLDADALLAALDGEPKP